MPTSLHLLVEGPRVIAIIGLLLVLFITLLYRGRGYWAWVATSGLAILIWAVRGEVEVHYTPP